MIFSLSISREISTDAYNFTYLAFICIYFHFNFSLRCLITREYDLEEILNVDLYLFPFYILLNQLSKAFKVQVCKCKELVCD